MIKRIKILIIFFFIALSLLVNLNHKCYSDSRVQNTPENVAKRFISALETKDFEHIFKDLYDKEALDDILKENQTDVNGIIMKAREFPLDKKLISGLKKAIKSPPKEIQIHLLNGKVQKVVEFREEKGIIERNSETGSTIYKTYYIYLVKRSNTYYIYQFGSSGTLVGPVSRKKKQ